MEISKTQIAQNASSILLGMLTATGIGQFFFHALGTLTLGVIGALGGWLFQHVIRPKIEKIFKIKK